MLTRILSDKQQYPNVTHHEIASDIGIADRWSTFDLSQYKPYVEALTAENKQFDLFIDDFSMFHALSGYIDTYNRYKNGQETPERMREVNQRIFQNYGYLSKARSLNIVSDGTSSWYFYQQKYLDFLTNSGVGFDPETKTYPLLTRIRDDLRKTNLAQLDEKTLSERDNLGGLILFSLVGGFKTVENTNVQQNKFFVAGTNTILDFNDFSPIKAKRPGVISDKGQIDQFFDPYHSVDIGLIEVYRSFTEASKQLFLGMFNIASAVSKDFLRDKTSVVYSGRLWEGNDGIIPSEAKIIINLYKSNVAQAGTTLQVVYKNHPRETAGYQDLMYTKLEELKNADTSLTNFQPKTNVIFLNKDVPMEYYVLEGFTNSDATLNSTVLYYSAFSTLIYLLNAAKLDASIAKVIVSQSDVDNAVGYFNGYPSRLFAVDKLMLSDELTK